MSIDFVYKYVKNSLELTHIVHIDVEIEDDPIFATLCYSRFFWLIDKAFLFSLQWLCLDSLDKKSGALYASLVEPFERCLNVDTFVLLWVSKADKQAIDGAISVSSHKVLKLKALHIQRQEGVWVRTSASQSAFCEDF